MDMMLSTVSLMGLRQSACMGVKLNTTILNNVGGNVDN